MPLRRSSSGLLVGIPNVRYFGTARGVPWTKDAVNCRFKRLKQEFNMPELCAYTLRHSFAYAKLSSGVDSILVAKLMGHADTRMLETRYGHIEKNVDVMLKAAQESPQLFPTVDIQPDAGISTVEDFLA